MMTSLPSRLVSIRRRAQLGVGGLELKQEVRDAWLDRERNPAGGTVTNTSYLIKETLVETEATDGDKR